MTKINQRFKSNEICYTNKIGEHYKGLKQIFKLVIL